MPRTRPPYREEFRREAIRLVAARQAAAPIAKDLGISDVTLSNWVKEEKREAGKRPDGLSDEREELARLRGENAKLRMEREILREGGGFFREGGRRAVGEIYSFIAAEKANYPVALMCGVFG